MKNKLEQVKNSWTWNHKMLILTLSLFTAHIIPLIPMPEAEAIQYERAPIIDTSIEYKLQERAKEMYKENESTDLEKYRLEAIRELNRELMSMIDESPFVDYEAMSETYGY